MKTIKIKGKDYVMVVDRLKYFLTEAHYKDWSIETEVVHWTSDEVVLRAIIRDDEGTIRATGLAHEEKTSSYINKTSYVENGETSALGRALGMLGIGIDTSIASADEMHMAVTRQEVGSNPYVKPMNFAAEDETDSIDRQNKKMEDDIGMYVIPIGKNKNRTLKELGPEKVRKFYDWSQNQPDFSAKNRVFVNAMEAFLEKMQSMSEGPPRK